MRNASISAAIPLVRLASAAHSRTACEGRGTPQLAIRIPSTGLLPKRTRTIVNEELDTWAKG